MSNNEHPITPPPELVQQLWSQCPAESENLLNNFATLTARWGADQELKASCDAIYEHEGQPLSGGTAEWLRAARRPKPPSLKEQALDELHICLVYEKGYLKEGAADIIRRALEQLDD